MRCDPLVSDGRVVGFTCGPGTYQHLVEASCPWCCLGEDTAIHATRLIYSGWCANDMVCACGQYWTDDMDSLPRMAEERREENVGMVAGMREAGIPLAWPEIEIP